MFVDFHDDIEMHRGGDLPHWEQDGKIQYVTFRLGDSLPQSRIADLKEAIENFKNRNPEPWDEATKQKYWRIIGPVEERLLDQGYGSCVLKYPHLRQFLIDALAFKNMENYRILSYVIMPNHVHILLQVFPGRKLSNILHSVKRFAAREINKCLNRSGGLWLDESFDRLVRSKDHLEYNLVYIRNNPKYIREGEYFVWRDEEFINQILQG